MEKLNTPDFEGFIEALVVLVRPPTVWRVVVENRCIHLYRENSEKEYAPHTALYYHLTGGEEIGQTFWAEEFQRLTGIPWWQVLEITYAEIACDSGRRYDRCLRNRMRKALGLPEERYAYA